jgi:hypothetical protein
MGDHIVRVSDEVENADVKLSMFAQTLNNGEALVTPIPRGFPMAAMPEVAARVAFMLRQYVELYAPKEPEPKKEPAQT